MQTQKSIESIISKVDYLDWKLRLGEMGDGWFVQVQFDAPDSESGLIETQHCRKWYVSKWMTDTEVVDTIYAAFERAVLHEFNETFRYMKQTIYNPHIAWHARYTACEITEHREPPDASFQQLIESLPEHKGDIEIPTEPGVFTKRLISLMKKVQTKQVEKFAQCDDGPVAIEPKIVSFCKPEEAEQYTKDARAVYHKTIDKMIADRENDRKPLPNQMSFLE